MSILKRSMDLSARTRDIRRRVFPKSISIPNKYRMQKDIADGRRSFLILEGFCPLKIGERVLLYCEDSVFIVQVVISRVAPSLLGDIDLKDMMLAGQSSYEALLENQKKDYPDIELESFVTVIEWNEIHGRLAEKPELVKIIHKELGTFR